MGQTVLLLQTALFILVCQTSPFRSSSIKLTRTFTLFSDVLNGISLLDVIKYYIPEVRQHGVLYKCLCPFHNDKNPSFVIYNNNRYYCFGCNASGGKVNFVMQKESMSYIEATQHILQITGFKKPNTIFLSINTNGPDKRTLDILECAAQFYSEMLLSKVGKGGAARSHLLKRNISSQTAVDYRIGYAPQASYHGMQNDPPTLTQNLTSLGFSFEEMDKSGLLRRSVVDRDYGRALKGSGDVVTNQRPEREFYEMFRDRLMIPIYDLTPRGVGVVGFGARVLKGSKAKKLLPLTTSNQESAPDPPAKYINTPETVAFSKKVTLFGLQNAVAGAKKEGRIVLVEGYFDAIGLYDVGVNFAVATMGTMITQEQLLKAARLVTTNRVILLLDTDDAGWRACIRVCELFLPLIPSTQLDLRIANLSQVSLKGLEGVNASAIKDPADLVEVLRSRLSEDDVKSRICDMLELAQSGHEWLLDRYMDAHKTAPSQATFSSAVRKISAFLQSLPAAADREYLSHYCGERLSGGKPAEKLRYEVAIYDEAKSNQRMDLQRTGRISTITNSKDYVLKKVLPSIANPRRPSIRNARAPQPIIELDSATKIGGEIPFLPRFKRFQKNYTDVVDTSNSPPKVYPRALPQASPLSLASKVGTPLKVEVTGLNFGINDGDINDGGSGHTSPILSKNGIGELSSEGGIVAPTPSSPTGFIPRYKRIELLKQQQMKDKIESLQSNTSSAAITRDL